MYVCKKLSPVALSKAGASFLYVLTFHIKNRLFYPFFFAEGMFEDESTYGNNVKRDEAISKLIRKSI